MNDRKKDYSKILGVSRNVTQEGFDWSKFTKKSEGIRVTKKSVRIRAKLVTGIVVAVIVITAIGGVAIWMMGPQTPTPVTKPTPSPPSVWMVKPPAPTPTPVTKPSPSPPPTATPAATVKPTPVTKMSCDMCHNRERTANLKAHKIVNGKPGCFDYENLGGCHGGPNATACTHVSQKGHGNTTCEQCHGTNLVDIHLKRGKPCTVCHRGKLSEIHGHE